MASIKFKEAQFYDFNRPQPLELAIRRTAAFAGVHRFDFEDRIDEQWDDLGDWTQDAGTWTAASNQLTGTGNGTAHWRYLTHDDQVPPSFVCTFKWVSGTQIGFVVRKKTGARDGLLISWTASQVAISTVNSDGDATNLSVMPTGISVPSRIQIVASWRYDRMDEDIKWLSLALWADGQCKIAYSYEITSDWAGNGIAFAAYNTGTFVVEDFRIGRYSRISEYLSIDPSETPSVGLSRAVQSTRILYMCRYDGTLRVWYPGNRTSTALVETMEQLQKRSRLDRPTITHVRVIGAVHALDGFSDGEGDLHMHQFKQVDNPYLVSDEEVSEECELILNDAKEAQTGYQIAVPGMPLLEAHDVITINLTEYRLMTIHTQAQAQQTGGSTYTILLDLRDYIEL